MFTYKNRNTFLQKLHPLVSIFIIFIYILSFIVVNNPLYLLLILLSLILLSHIDGSIKDLFKYGRLMLPFAILIMILNPLLVRDGSTILYIGKIKFPVIGSIVITLESIMYGIFSGIKVICITLAFGFGNLIIHPDRSFGFFSKYLKKSSLLMSMIVTMFPNMMKSYENIREIEKLRGNILVDKKMKNTIKNGGNIVNILFLSSLEDSLDIAESMYSRGYGSCKKRSAYFVERFELKDKILIIILIGLFIELIVLGYKEIFNMSFYPRVDNPYKILSIKGIIFCTLLFIPSIINWWWKNWK
ncbi:energy-coupling factor transporter transmembrane component T family protein [Clostridium cochlearium]|uniref:energy-coupling factor transporter transmembrane component T family protein n=1 Tax=Clostridium cochlearium TaxID=1494 RepID=UPI00156EF5C4|nr:energy-coupling factor transporter transmembrane component T [Clostridium cochlearium]MBV1820763.1 energy-coupling factor transporter transmembrane protein EcfT [Bacteroidales bacterium MSK.15.36]MCG4580038.1 energy-coupling factor transporter transmembrane protein EcfT [Clostridium cochlearium]NSJ90852.1 energy-coupling factor transporter transmembrane protein EcfT [Coprococcus sp. MSK.21.13]